MSNSQNYRPTMGDLLQKIDDQGKIIVGDQVKGTIVFLAKNQCLLNVEDQTLGIVRGAELYNEEFLSRLKVGEEVEAVVLSLDNELGMLELSFREIGKDRLWAEIMEAVEEKKTIDAKIKDINRGGFLVRVKGIEGFLPASLLSPAHAIKNVGVEDSSLVNQMKKYIGLIFSIKVLSANTETETIIVSEKAVSDEVAVIKLAKYKIGDTVEGKVVGIVDFGLFVRFDDELEGLIHISEIAWKKVEDPRKDFKIGQAVQAKIVDIDKDSRVNLSIKQLLPNPWIEFVKDAKEGDVFKGTVAKIVSYGVIVVNGEDVQGLCHITQLSTDPVENPAKIRELVQIGQAVTPRILNVDPKEKLYLTMLPDFDEAKRIEEQTNRAREKAIQARANAREEAVQDNQSDRDE